MHARSIVVTLIVLLAGCPKSSSKPTASPPAGPPPARCLDVTYSCTMPGLGCFEGGDDFGAQVRAHCGAAATATDGPCAAGPGLGTCTAYEGLMPHVHGCGTLVFAEGAVADVAAAQAACEKFKGTYTAP